MLGIAVLLGGSLPWGALLAPANLRFAIAVPWSAVYGGLTWAANSILPALVMHAGGDVWSLGRLWMTGKPEWQLSSATPALVRDTGVDAGFVVAATAFAGLTALTIWAYTSVHRLSSNNAPRTQHAEL